MQKKTDEDLRQAVEKWRTYIQDKTPGDSKLARKTGWTRHFCRKVIQAAGRPPAPRPTTPPTEAEPTGHDLLFHQDYVHNPETDTYVTFLSCCPKPLAMAGHKHRALIAAYSNWNGEPATINQICRDHHIPRPWLIEYLRKHGVTHDNEPFSREDVAERPVEELVEEALQAKRQVLYQRYEKAKWKETKDSSDKWNNFEATLLPRLEALAATDAGPPPVLDLPKAPRPYAALLSPTDFHWGMYSWDGDVGRGNNYNRAIAEKRLFDHTQDIINRLPGRPEEIIVTIGSDFFHIDGQVAKTTRGTEMDTDGTPTEILVTGCDLTRRHIDLLRQVAPVKVVLMSGNHDAHNGRALLLVLAAWYRGVDDVTVEQVFTKRVYIKYGNLGVVAAHGDTTKTKDLGAIFATEGAAVWNKTVHHIAIGGHLHHMCVWEVGGLTHYLMPSLAGVDRWHSESGYVTGRPALVCLLLDREQGVSGWLKSAA